MYLVTKYIVWDDICKGDKIAWNTCFPKGNLKNLYYWCYSNHSISYQNTYLLSLLLEKNATKCLAELFRSLRPFISTFKVQSPFFYEGQESPKTIRCSRIEILYVKGYTFSLVLLYLDLLATRFLELISGFMVNMAIPVVKFSREGYKIRNRFG